MLGAHRRLVCASHNAFTPSTALWQYFVLPNQRLSLRRQLSTNQPQGLKEQAPASRNPDKPSKERTVRYEYDKRIISQNTTLQGSRLHLLRTETDHSSERSLAKHDRSEAGNEHAAQEDYEGVNIRPMTEERYDEASLPWLVRLGAPCTGSERLTAEVAAFHAYMIPNSAEREARAIMANQLLALIAHRIPQCDAVVFGSEEMGLALSISDIDIRLFLKESYCPGSGSEGHVPPKAQRRRQVDSLKGLEKLLQNDRKYMLCQFRFSRYPLINVQHKNAGTDIQIVLSTDRALSKEYVNRFLEQYPGLRELYTIIRVMFAIRGLNDVYRGGFGSYSIFMMIVAALQQMPQAHSSNLGQSLLAFMTFWAHFDTYQLGISLEPPELFAKDSRETLTAHQKRKAEEKHQKIAPYILTLQDPADPTNDLGRKGFGIKHVQKTLQHLERQLRKDLSKNSRPSLLAPLVGHAHPMYRERRAKMVGYAKASAIAKKKHIGGNSQRSPRSDKGMAPEQVEVENAVVAEGVMREI